MNPPPVGPEEYMPDPVEDDFGPGMPWYEALAATLQSWSVPLLIVGVLLLALLWGMFGPTYVIPFLRTTLEQSPRVQPTP